MSRARRGAVPSVDVLEQRFDDWAADHVAGMLAAAGIRYDDVLGMRMPPVDDGHLEVIVETASKGTVNVGQLPFLDFSRAYGDLAVGYLEELAGRVALRPGRPRGLTSIPDDSPLREAVRAMDQEGRRVSRKTLSARAGFTEDELRGYLRATNRAMAELLEDLRH